MNVGITRIYAKVVDQRIQSAIEEGNGFIRSKASVGNEDGMQNPSKIELMEAGGMDMECFTKKLQI